MAAKNVELRLRHGDAVGWSSRQAKARHVRVLSNLPKCHLLATAPDEDGWTWLLNRRRRELSVVHLEIGAVKDNRGARPQAMDDLDSLHQRLRALGNRWETDPKLLEFLRIPTDSDSKD